MIKLYFLNVFTCFPISQITAIPAEQFNTENVYRQSYQSRLDCKGIHTSIFYINSVEKTSSEQVALLTTCVSLSGSSLLCPTQLTSAHTMTRERQVMCGLVNPSWVTHTTRPRLKLTLPQQLRSVRENG